MDQARQQHTTGWIGQDVSSARVDEPWRVSGEEESGRERKGGTSSPRRNTTRRCAASAATRTATAAAMAKRRATNWARGAGFRPILGRRGRLFL
jgi:hypothetical protein